MSCESSDVPEPLSGKFKESFAYVTIKDRLPVILTRVIDGLYRERHAISAAYGLKSTEETKLVIGRLSELRNEMLTSKPIIPLKDDMPDVSLWNNYLEYQRELYGFEPTWFDSPWLYVECYLYRRIKEAFELSVVLKDYDPFKQQKESSFLSSLSAAVLVGAELEDVIKQLSCNDNSEILHHFKKFVHISLWGNKCDLSLSGGSESYQSSNPLAQLDILEEKILVNDTEIFRDLLRRAADKHPNAVCIDIILDNAGFELFSDMCLLEFFLRSNLIHKVRFHVKTMPWYVSDTLSSDIDWLINIMVTSSEEVLANLGKIWLNNLRTGIWTIEHEVFWTLPHDYSEMNVIDPTLFSKLSESDLIIFKGDLNYRKLTSDRKWDPTTPFCVSLRGFMPASICSLRTIKNDVVTGFKPGVKEKMDKISPNWLFTGEYAVIQCVSV